MSPTTASAFETEPTLCTVCPLAGVPLSSSAKPTPPEKTSFPSTATATDRPGSEFSARIRSM